MKKILLLILFTLALKAEIFNEKIILNTLICTSRKDYNISMLSKNGLESYSIPKSKEALFHLTKIDEGKLYCLYEKNNRIKYSKSVKFKFENYNKNIYTKTYLERLREGY